MIKYILENSFKRENFNMKNTEIAFYSFKQYLSLDTYMDIYRCTYFASFPCSCRIKLWNTSKPKLFWQLRVKSQMLGAYVTYLDIGKKTIAIIMRERISRRRLLWAIYRYPFVHTMELRKALKNMGKVLAKIAKKSVFSKMKLSGLLMKKRTSFPSKICLVFWDLNTFSGNN